MKVELKCVRELATESNTLFQGSLKDGGETQGEKVSVSVPHTGLCIYTYITALTLVQH